MLVVCVKVFISAIHCICIMLLNPGFESCVSRCRERKDKIKKMKDHLMVESASVRIQALLLVRKVSLQLNYTFFTLYNKRLITM